MVREKPAGQGIFNKDQRSQFTIGKRIDTLEAAGVEISMDGKGRWIDVFI
jgi:putative transposase